MELIDFILEIDCLSQFYDWGKLTVSIVTNHTWTTAALSRDQELNFPESAEQLCLFKQFTSPKLKKQLTLLLQKTLHRVPESDRRKKKKREKKGHWQNRLPWNQTEYSVWITYRIQWDGLIWIWVKVARKSYKWAHCPNNLSQWTKSLDIVWKN